MSLILWENPSLPGQYSGVSIISVPIDAAHVHPSMFMEALEVLAFAQEWARETERVESMELVATVQHGHPIAYGYTLHFAASGS